LFPPVGGAHRGIVAELLRGHLIASLSVEFAALDFSLVPEEVGPRRAGLLRVEAHLLFGVAALLQDGTDGVPLGPETFLARGSAALQRARALEVLEYAGTPEAKQLLEKLAKGKKHARLTRAAKVILERIAERPGGTP
jgi:hypothetical protein